MSIKTKAQLKVFFENGKTPDAQAFIDLIDTLIPIDPTNTYAGEGDKRYRSVGTSFQTELSDDGIRIKTAAGQSRHGLTDLGLDFVELNNVSLLYAIVEIPAWDMDTLASIEVDATTFLKKEKVLDIQIVIESDDGGVFSNYRTSGGLDWFMDSASADGTITLSRLAGGEFDNVAFSQVASRRGRLLISYNGRV